MEYLLIKNEDKNLYGPGLMIVQFENEENIENIQKELNEKPENIDELAKQIKGILQITDKNFVKEIKEKVTEDKNEDIDLVNLLDKMKITTQEGNLKPTDAGIKKGNIGGKNVIFSQYTKYVEFKKPYQDPHFTFLSDKIEYWVPKVHMMTGLPVWKEKEEVLKRSKIGTFVYLKLQSVKTKVNNEEKIIYYFRKFFSFEDFIKSWQLTYIRQYYEVIEKLKQEEEEEKIIILVLRKKFLRTRIKDIKEYFERIKEQENNEFIRR